jgi:hypothetical protein
MKNFTYYKKSIFSLSRIEYVLMGTNNLPHSAINNR